MLLDYKSSNISNYKKCLYCHLLGFVASQEHKTPQQAYCFSSASSRYGVANNLKLNEQRATEKNKKQNYLC